MFILFNFKAILFINVKSKYDIIIIEINGF